MTTRRAIALADLPAHVQDRIALERVAATPRQGRPRSPLARSEHEEQAALFAFAAEPATLAQYPELAELFSVPNFSGRLGNAPPIAAIIQGAKLKREGRKKGVEDVMLLVPRGGYHGCLIELKKRTGRPSDVSAEQREWHRRHRARGYRVEVCWGWEHARDVLVEYLSLDAAGDFSRQQRP